MFFAFLFLVWEGDLSPLVPVYVFGGGTGSDSRFEGRRFFTLFFPVPEEIGTRGLLGSSVIPKCRGG